MSSEDLIHEANNPATTPARLAELAGADSSTWPAIAGNPAAYEGLLQWLGERNDPAVNAVLTARTQASMPPVPPPAAPAPPADAPVAAPAAAPAETPTVVTPVEPAFSAPVQPEPESTAVFAAPSTEPTAVFQTPAAPEPTATYAPVAAATETPATTTEGSGSGKNLAIVIGMVAVVIALIAGAAFGATQVFGDDDDDDKNSSLLGDKKSSGSDDSDKSDLPLIEPPELDSPEDDFPEDPYPENDVPEASGEFCTSMTAIQKANQELVSRTGESPDLDELKEMGEDMADAYEDLAETAPSELQTDIRAMGAYFELMTNPTADSASKMSESISEYAESAQKVSVYYAQNCL